MVSKQIQRLPKSIVEVTITVPWVDVSPRFNEVVSKVNQDLELPGFRKGQAPLELVEQKASNQIQQEFLKLVMPQSLVEALSGTDVVPIDYPQYQIVSYAKGSDLTFKARVSERPKVSVGDYKTVKASRPEIKAVTDEEVQKIIDDLFKRWQAKNPPTASTLPTGPAGSLNFTSPSPSEPTNQPQISAPSDEFAKAMGAQSLDDLKKKIKEDLESEAKYNNELDYEENILQEVEKITTVDLPEVLIQDELNRMLVSLQRRVADMGLLLEDYLKGQGKTLEGIKSEWRLQAEKNVKMELGLAEIARIENVSISDAELIAEIDKIQDNKMKQQFEAEEPKMHLRHALRQTKTLNLLKTLVG